MSKNRGLVRLLKVLSYDLLFFTGFINIKNWWNWHGGDPDDLLVQSEKEKATEIAYRVVPFLKDTTKDIFNDNSKEDFNIIKTWWLSSMFELWLILQFWVSRGFPSFLLWTLSTYLIRKNKVNKQQPQYWLLLTHFMS
jgi:hypothetical protein